MLTPASRSGFPALALVCGLLPIQATQARDKPQDQTISTSVTGPVYANGGARLRKRRSAGLSLPGSQTAL